MRQLNYQLSEMCKHNRDGSFATQRARIYTLNQAANDLHDLGFRKLAATGLKPKHVDSLLTHWNKTGVTAGTLKNRLTHLRWWASRVQKEGLIPKSNAALNIERRVYVTNIDKSQKLDGRLEDIKDPRLNMSLRLQEAFGLRREESIKFVPAYADRGDKIVLKSSWTKGGRPRDIPIKTAEQRQLLDECHKLAGKISLIPPNKQYDQQLKVYENQTAKAGFHKLHGLRHRYAQQRYEAITGWKAPVQGGPKRAELSSADKQLDNTARQLISRELGHERLDVVSVYIGS